MSKNKKIAGLIVSLCIILLLLFLIGYLPKEHVTHKLNKRVAKTAKPRVSVFVAKPQDAPIEIVLPSQTEANHITPIWARANGYLGKLNVDIGDVVKKGDILAVLETPEIDQQYLEAKATLESLKAKRDLAELTMGRFQTVTYTKPEAIAQTDMDSATSNYLQAVADVKSQESAIQYYRDLQEFKNIVAPFDGIIIERNVDLGSLISAGSNGTPQQLFVIAETDIIRVFVYVPQYVARSVKENLLAMTRIREYPNQIFSSRIVRYAKALDQVSRTMRTELHIDNKDGELVTGLYAEVTLHLAPSRLYYLLPPAAIIIRAGVPHVAVLDDKDIVHLKKVKIGRDNGVTMEIVEGVEPNDRIVANASDRIKEGVQVAVIQTTVEKPVVPYPVVTDQ